MSLRTHLQAELSKRDTHTLLRRLGYAPDNRRALERLLSTVEGDHYALDQSFFDFRYSGADFLRALCRLLDLPPELVETEITRVKTELAAETTAFKPYLWVDTHFRRTSQPLFALAACEQQRYLPLDWRLPHQPPALQRDTVHAVIDAHQARTQGDLGIWGRIQAYWYFYAEHHYWLFSPQGECLEQHTGPVPSRARMAL